jgi:AcrR family transcriptional regulator
MRVDHHEAVLPLLDQEVAAGAASLRARNRDRARAAIVESALELFAARGFDDVSVADVAAGAGVSPATVARYFPAKELILFADRDVNAARLRIELLGRPRSESPMRALVGALLDQPPLPADARRRLLRSRQAIARSAVLRGRAGEGLRAWRDGIADALVERGGIDPLDARSLATAVVALLDDAAARWAEREARTDLGDEVRASLESLERTRRRS